MLKLNCDILGKVCVFWGGQKIVKVKTKSGVTPTVHNAQIADSAFNPLGQAV